MREVHRKRVWVKRKREAMKLLMKKNETEWEKYERRDTWTQCQLMTLKVNLRWICFSYAISDNIKFRNLIIFTKFIKKRISSKASYLN